MTSQMIYSTRKKEDNSYFSERDNSKGVSNFISIKIYNSIN